jgi:hypothetical protein
MEGVEFVGVRSAGHSAGYQVHRAAPQLGEVD